MNSLWIVGFVGLLTVLPVSAEHISGKIDLAPQPGDVDAMSPIQVPPAPERAPSLDRVYKCAAVYYYVKGWQLDNGGDMYAQYGVAENVAGEWTYGPPLVTVAGDVAYVTLPARPIERLTLAELQRRWPTPCALVLSVVGTQT